MTTTPSPATASTPPLIQRLAAGDCLWVIVTDTEVQSLLRAGHAYIAATLPHRSEMVTLAITEEGRSAAYTQRAFFRDLDDAETAKDVQATREAAQRKPDEFRSLLRKHLYAVNDGFIVPCILDMSAAWETIAKGVNAAPYDHEKVAERVMALISATRDGFTEALHLARAAHPEQRIGQVIVNAGRREWSDLFYVTDADLCAALTAYASRMPIHEVATITDIEIEPLHGMTLWAAAKPLEDVVAIGHGQGDSSTVTKKDALRFADALRSISESLPDRDWSRV